MAFGIGLKVLRRLCEEQKPLVWQKSKLSAPLFKAHEQPAFEWVEKHLKQFHALPKLETLFANFPEIKEVETPEPPAYYVQMLENAYFHQRINQANIDSQLVLKNDQDAHEKAMEILRGALNDITQQKYRLRILDVGKDAPAMVLTAYHQAVLTDSVGLFGWDYMDVQSGGTMPGDVISFVGRPAAGKSWLMLWIALTNWQKAKRNVLFVSMEMSLLAISQRLTAMYTHSNISQLKMSGYSKSTYDKFVVGLKGMTQEDGKFYVVDGNLAATAEDIFVLADQLGCEDICIDGAYLVRHTNARLDRFTRVAENVELFKRYTGDLGKTTFASWQLSREAEKKNKTGQKQEASLADIGYSDAIGQISSIVLGMFQEEGVETMMQRQIRVMKGRNGEVGQFSIGWDFTGMNFHQVDPVVGGAVASQELQWI